MDYQNLSNPITLPKKLKGTFELLKESFKIYCLKAKSLLGIMGIAIILIFLGTLIPLVGKEPLAAFIIATILLLISIFLGLLSILIILYLIKDNLDIKSSLNKGFSKIKSFLWVWLCLFCLSKAWIILGIFILGMAFIFIIKEAIFDFFDAEFNLMMIIEEMIVFPLFFPAIFFIILGIVFFVWFFLSIYVFLFEEKKGMSALFGSKQLVKGSFWQILWRFLVFGFVSITIIYLLVFLLIWLNINLSIISAITYFLTWITIPLFLIYGMLIYKNLQEIQADIPYQEPRKRTKRIYVSVGILGLLSLLTNFGMYANFIYRGDDYPLYDDTHLWLSKIEISRQNNAFYYFQQMKREINIPEGKHDLFMDIFEGEKWDENFVRELLKYNEKAFYYFEKGIQLPYFQDPAHQNPRIVNLETPLSPIGFLVNFNRIQSIKTIYYLREGKEKQAFEQSINMIRMGQLLQSSPRSLILMHTASSVVKGTGLRVLGKIIQEDELSPEMLKEYIVYLERFKLNEQGLRNTFKMEYITKVNTMDKYFNIKSNFLFKPNKSRKWHTQYYTAAVNNVDKVCKKIIELPMPDILLDGPSLMQLYLEENLIGRMFRDMVVVTLDHFFSQKCEEDFSIKATQLLMAIRAYQIKNDRIPASLEELVPRFISEIPKDSFDGQPIRFSAEKRKIWSVGENFIDNGGIEKLDIVFEIKF